MPIPTLRLAVALMIGLYSVSATLADDSVKGLRLKEDPGLRVMPIGPKPVPRPSLHVIGQAKKDFPQVYEVKQEQSKLDQQTVEGPGPIASAAPGAPRPVEDVGQIPQGWLRPQWRPALFNFDMKIYDNVRWLPATQGLGAVQKGEDGSPALSPPATEEYSGTLVVDGQHYDLRNIEVTRGFQVVPGPGAGQGTTASAGLLPPPPITKVMARLAPAYRLATPQGATSPGSAGRPDSPVVREGHLVLEFRNLFLKRIAEGQVLTPDGISYRIMGEVVVDPVCRQPLLEADSGPSGPIETFRLDSGNTQRIEPSSK